MIMIGFRYRPSRKNVVLKLLVENVLVAIIVIKGIDMFQSIKKKKL